MIRAGHSPRDAERQARLELGSGETYREECRRSYGLLWLDVLGQDLRYAVRALRRSPGFTAVAVLSLALGIGANTAVFGVLDALVLRPLPVRSPEELVFVEPTTHSFPAYRDLRDRNVTLSGLIAYRVSPVGLGTGDAVSRGWAYLATGNYFDVLGVKPLAGRFFHAEDDVNPGASALAVLSFDCWRNRFSADAAIVGRSIRVNGHPYTVLGVAPAGFHGTETIYWPDVWVPMAMQPQIEEHDWLQNRDTSDCLVAGRLKPHVTRAQAEGNLRAIADDLARTYPRSDAGIEVRLSKLGLMGATLRNPVEAFVFGVIILAAMVLLAACANLASLMTARAADRAFEIAIRVSIGASRVRIVRQLMTESAFLALLGGVAGCALAALILATLSRLTLAEIPVRVNVTAEWRVFLFGLAAALASALLFGAAPARQGLQANPNRALRGGASAFKPRGWPLRELLLAAQVALCCVLVTACFVAMRGAQRAFQMPVGIQPHGVSVTGFDLGLAQYAQKHGEVFQRRALDATWQLPGVAAAAFADSFPLGVDQSSSGTFRYGETDFRASKAIRVSHYDISPGYFRSIGTRLLAGRDFTWHDDAKSPLTAIVNQTFARKVLGNQNGVGLYYRVGDSEGAAGSSDRHRGGWKIPGADGRSAARHFSAHAPELQWNHLPAGARRPSAKRPTRSRARPPDAAGRSESRPRVAPLQHWRARKPPGRHLLPGSRRGVGAKRFRSVGVDAGRNRHLRAIGLYREPAGARDWNPRRHWRAAVAGLNVCAGTHGRGSRSGCTGGNLRRHRLHGRAGACGAAGHAARPRGVGRCGRHYACGSAAILLGSSSARDFRGPHPLPAP